jgi:hypothetical protein
MLGIEAEQVGWHLASRYGDGNVRMPQTDTLDTDTYKTSTASAPP